MSNVPRVQGWDVGSGGSGYAAEFRDIGRTVVRRFKGKGTTEVAGVSIAKFEETLNKAVIETTDEVLKKGDATVDALNFSSLNKIRLSLVHWATTMDFPEKRRVVIHEVVGLMGNEDRDRNFELTTKVIGALGRQPVYFNKFDIHGDVAKKLIEMMFWQSFEIKTEKLPAWTSTTYKIPHDSKRPEIQCSNVVYVTPFRDNETIDTRCHIWKQAYLGEDGILHVSLVEEDGDHALWRLFDNHGVRKFDWGVIKGDLSKALYTLEFYL